MSLRSLVSQRERVLVNTRLVWTRILGSQKTPFPTQALATTRPTAIKSTNSDNNKSYASGASTAARRP